VIYLRLMGFFKQWWEITRITSKEESLRRELEYVAAIQVWQRNALAAMKATLDLAIAWRVAIERPEVDLRDDLDAMIQNISDEVAQAEEHIV
jgi:hypothetical protein